MKNQRMLNGLLPVALFALLVMLSGCATPLINAIDRGDTKEMERLIAAGANVNESNENSLFTPLFYAAANGQVEAVRLLIKNGADVNLRSGFNGHAPLHGAILRGHADVVSLLLEKGADPTMADGLGRYPSAIVGSVPFSDKSNADIIRRLLEKAEAEIRAREAKAAMALNEAEVKARNIVTAPAHVENTAISRSEDIQDVPSFNAPARQNDVAVVIGIEEYRGLPRSDFSRSDAGLVKDYLRAMGFQERNIALLTDSSATLSDIKKTVEGWLPNRVKKDSSVFIYYSGHGAPDVQSGEAYMVPFEGDPNYLEDTGYPLKRLYDRIAKLEAREVVVVLDSCFSGSGGRSVLAKGARPLVMMTDKTVLPPNVAIISSTQGSQISTSSQEKGHGVFTYYFLKAIKDGKKDLKEIYGYLKPLVEDEARTLNVQQSPSLNPAPETMNRAFILVR